MMFYGMLLALLAGLSVAVQAAFNTQLSKYSGNLWTTLVSHLGGAIVMAVVILIVLWCSPHTVTSYRQFKEAPWYAYTGGIFGVIIVFSVLNSVRILPLATVLALVTVGQLVTSAVVDHFGIGGLTPNPLNLQRWLGIIVMGIGVVLLKK